MVDDTIDRLMPAGCDLTLDGRRQPIGASLIRGPEVRVDLVHTRRPAACQYGAASQSAARAEAVDVRGDVRRRVSASQRSAA